MLRELRPAEHPGRHRCGPRLARQPAPRAAGLPGPGRGRVAPTYWLPLRRGIRSQAEVDSRGGASGSSTSRSYTRSSSRRRTRGIISSSARAGTVSYAYGPLAPPHQIAGMVLGGPRVLVHRLDIVARGTSVGRRQALVIGPRRSCRWPAASSGPSATRSGLPLAVNLSPVLAPVSSLALGYELLRSGLADIAPYAALQAFNAIDRRRHRPRRRSGRRGDQPRGRATFPEARVGMRLDDAAPELAAAAETCLLERPGYTGFDLELGGLLYWVRVRRTMDRRGVPSVASSCSTDVTEMRATQARIVELSRALGEDCRTSPRCHPRSIDGPHAAEPRPTNGRRLVTSPQSKGDTDPYTAGRPRGDDGPDHLVAAAVGGAVERVPDRLRVVGGQVPQRHGALLRHAQRLHRRVVVRVLPRPQPFGRIRPGGGAVRVRPVCAPRHPGRRRRRGSHVHVPVLRVVRAEAGVGGRVAEGARPRPDPLRPGRGAHQPAAPALRRPGRSRRPRHLWRRSHRSTSSRRSRS